MGSAPAPDDMPVQYYSFPLSVQMVHGVRIASGRCPVCNAAIYGDDDSSQKCKHVIDLDVDKARAILAA